MVDRRVAAGLVILGLAVLLLLPPVAFALDEPFYVSLVRRIMIFAIAAVGLDIILGYGGLVSLGHAAFFGAGAYVVGVLSFHAAEDSLLLGWIPGTDAALIAWPAAVLTSALLAFLIGLLSLRTSGVYFIMITLAFAQMLYFFFVSLEGYGGDDGLQIWGRSRLPGDVLADDTAFYYVVLGLLVTLLWLGRRMIDSRFGRVIRGIRQNERRMQAIGFATFRYKLVAFVIAGAMAGLAGALMASQDEFVSPSLMHWTRSGEFIVMIVLGGMATLFGPVIGAAVYLLLEEVLSSYTQHWQIILGPVLVLVVLFGRGGIVGALRRLAVRDG